MGHVTYPRTAGSERYLNTQKAREVLELLLHMDLSSLSSINGLLAGINISLLPPELRRKVLQALAAYQSMLDKKYREDLELQSRLFKQRYEQGGEISWVQYSKDLFAGTTKTFEPSWLGDYNQFNVHHANLEAGMLTENNYDNIAVHLNATGQYEFVKHPAVSLAYDRKHGLLAHDIPSWRDGTADKVINQSDDRSTKVATKEEKRAARNSIENDLEQRLVGITEHDQSIVQQGWIDGNVVNGSIDNRLNSSEGCMNILEDAKAITGGFKELEKVYSGLLKAGYQRDHITPISNMLAPGEKRETVNAKLIEGLGDYNVNTAYTLFLNDSQTKGEEHRMASEGQRTFAEECLAKGEQATLKEWIDKSVEWNTKIFESRFMYQNGVNNRSELSTQRTQQAFMTAMALRNLQIAHFTGLGAKLETKIGNGVVGKKGEYKPEAKLESGDNL
ncbi:hypothetical protein [Vibrio lentus]|uniref:hypothetical protein n=1 Tax=Vibrio lentus TaxID=136468 RepID=UPI0010BDADC2|nr:hypothetical protein [Vibrio lentus]TKG17706.1 hypothetical protein FCW05_12420 [Vibrio lentus]